MLPSPQNLLTSFPRRPASEFDAGGGWFDLDDWIGPQHPSTRADVAKLEAILANSGDYSLERTQGPTGYWGLALDDGIRRYQKRNGLEVDGILRPGGPTIEHMRENFAGLLDGYAPPTPEDIDAHHDVVGDDDPGTIAWRRPDVSFGEIPGLPEIDQEADASNSRLVRTMLRTGDIDGYASLMKAAIEQGGKRGLAEVSDLAKKLDESSTGLGGRFASAITGLMSQEQLDELGIEVPVAPPKGTVQMAALRADKFGHVGGRTDVLNEGGRGGGLAIGGGAPAAAAVKILTDNFKLPGFTPADNENKPAQTPPPALLDVPIHTGHPAPEPMGPNHTGHPAPAPDPSASVHTPTQSPEKRREEIAKLVGNYLEVRVFGGRRDYRGNDSTIDSTTAIAKVCAEVVENSELPALLEQKGGGNWKGKEEKYMEEVTIKGGKKTRRSDYALGPVDETNPRNFGHINSYTAKVDGTPIAKEVEAFLDILNSVIDPELVAMVPKMKPGEDIEAYKENVARPACEKIVDAQIRRLKAKQQEGK